MAGRVAWILAGGAAIVGGMMMQDRIMFGFDDDQKVERHVDRDVDRDVDSIVDGIIDKQTDRITVVGDDGQNLDASPQAKRELASAVADLVKAEAALAVADIRDVPRDQERAARDRRDQAQQRVERLADQIKDEERREELQDQRHEIRDQVRSEIRDALRN